MKQKKQAVPVVARANRIGMPESLLLNEFGSHVWAAFGGPPYQVGSTLKGSDKPYRDVDVRMILDDEEYERQGFGDPDHAHRNGKWVVMTMAFSLLGKQMTGLPIDFQIQQQSNANKSYDGPRSALGIVPLRIGS